jgi:ribosomal protein L31
MSLILAIWETEIRRIVVSGQHRQKKKKSWQNHITTEKKLSIEVHACHPSYAGKTKIGG